MSYIRNRRRHPTDRRPQWLQALDAEIRYWLRKTSHLRHSEPFNKRPAGMARRATKRHRLTQKQQFLTSD